MFSKAIPTRSAIRRRAKPHTLPHLLIAISCFHSTTTTHGLKIALLTGSTRTSSPPTVLHPRVNAYIHKTLQQRGHDVTRIDPGDLPLLEKPHFAYPPGKAPPKMQEIYSILQDADGYVCVTPEYNHSPSPALLNILNHFGSSTFSFKPSAIVTYSAGQWGGTRAGVALRTTLSELGCLPVSAMIHIPKAQEAFDRDGNVTSKDNNDPEQWQKYCGRCFSQLEWWAEAAQRHREVADPFDESPVFVKSPDQRNAP
eukprot:CAMPEP_0172313654 /NCGR_PEP_ID=MMETSP1058-20130122/20689_1 /TAXON_ID=83371 /ORGANISM="Detonula confervacea, Strain CCMP 353" /LENGTH=254 /DNA_ID=CAMNT_0013027345 /DNA_START=1 /DNA_END=765 /DNA_ORIENTATION=+